MTSVEISRIFSAPRIELDCGELTFPLDYAEAVDANWEASNTDGKFFRGKVLVATQIDMTPEAPTILIRRTDYAHYLFAAKDPQRRFECFAVYCSAILITADGYLIFGEMGDQTSTPGQIQCPGGGIEIRNDVIDPIECCRREISEEVGASFVEHTSPLVPICIKSGGRGGHIGIFFVCPLKFTIEEAKRYFSDHISFLADAGQEPELRAIHAVKLQTQELKGFLKPLRGRLVDYMEPLFLDYVQMVSAALISHQHGQNAG